MFVSPRLRGITARPRIGESHGSRKTRRKTPRAPQEISPAHKRLLPHKEQAVPVGAGGRQSRGAFSLPSPPKQKAAIPPALDSANRRRRAQRGADLQPVYARAEGCRR